MLFSTTQLQAQTVVNSPYSSYGIGELGGMDHAVFSGIGNTNISYIDSNILNYYNPASYGFIAKHKPLFSTGASGKFSSFSEGGIKSNSILTNVQHFALAFPVHNRVGTALGLRPYANRGYDFVSGQSIGTDSINYYYSGDGSVSEVFLGVAGNIIKSKNTKLSVGSNLGFLFGRMGNTRRSAIYSSASNYKGGVNTKITMLNDFHYDAGLYFEQKFSKHKIGLSAVFDPSQKLNGYFENSLYYAGHIFKPTTYDTIYQSTVKDTLISPSRMSFGLRYGILLSPDSTNNRKLDTEINFFASYSMEDWSTYSNPFDNNEMLSSYRLTFGIEVIPEVMLATKYKTTKFHQKLRYRAGYYQYTLPYMQDGLRVNEKGVTAGIAIPISLNSSVNAGFTYGMRGTTDSQLLNEKYYGINIGITIAPIGDIWFRKPKLN